MRQVPPGVPGIKLLQESSPVLYLQHVRSAQWPASTQAAAAARQLLHVHTSSMPSAPSTWIMRSYVITLRCERSVDQSKRQRLWGRQE
jgi:hypothetical protein